MQACAVSVDSALFFTRATKLYYSYTELYWRQARARLELLLEIRAKELRTRARSEKLHPCRCLLASVVRSSTPVVLDVLLDVFVDSLSPTCTTWAIVSQKMHMAIMTIST